MTHQLVSNTCSMDDLANNSLPWVEKYRPKCVDEIISHKEIIKSLNIFVEKKSLPHLLFFGPSGSGKTSTILCIAKKIYGDYLDYMVMRLNASNDRGVGTVRADILRFVVSDGTVFLPDDMKDLFKLVILDEMDSMTIEAQCMLQQIIEAHSKNVRFCIICNEIDKISCALQSRCILYRFSSLCAVDVVDRINYICNEEKLKCSKKVITTITKVASGDMRNVVNTLQSLKKITNGNVTSDDVYKMSGFCTSGNLDDIFTQLKLARDKKKSFATVYIFLCKKIADEHINISNLLNLLGEKILQSDINNKSNIIKQLAVCECYDSNSVEQKIIIGCIVSAFILP